MYITDEIKQEILNQTDGGLDVLLRLFPDASTGIDQKKKFKIRSGEKTASAKLHKQKDGTWVLTDFGDEAKGKNAITWTMIEKNLDYNQACEWIINEFQIQLKDGPKPKPLSKMKSRPADADEENGLMKFNKRKFTVDELKIMFAPSLLMWVEKSSVIESKDKQTEESKYKKAFDVLVKYGWNALDSYTYTKDGKTYTYESSPEYPIFIMEEGEFCKIYKPKEKEKQYRFLYYPVGKFPSDHVWGLKQAKKAYERLQKEAVEESEKAELEGQSKKGSKAESTKLQHVIKCSGERDSMNVALMGYYPVWPNSETIPFSKALYKELSRISHGVYNLPDIDSTGVEQGVKAALQHIELKTIWLPFDLLSEKDWRGNSCKDLRDFLAWKDKRKKDFDGLVSIARSCKFWYKTEKADKNGNVYTNWELNDVNLHYFLWCSGFYKISSTTTKGGFQYIQVTGHIVRKVDPKEIRNHVKAYLESHYADHKLLSRFMRSPILNDSAMEFLSIANFEFKSYTYNSQILYFKNEIWNVTPNEIQKIKPKDAARKNMFVWDSKLKPHTVTKLDYYFEKHEDPETGIIEARILNTDCLFFQYLIATCRIHWQKEQNSFEDKSKEEHDQYWIDYKHTLSSPLLNENEISEQHQHLANKLFVFGYLLHQYKDQGRPWGVYCIDAKLSDEGKSSGRSGKSVFMKAIREIVQTKTISGRYTKVTENIHIYEGVDEYTNLILVDDCHEHLKLDFFFTSLTDSMTVNPKHVSEVEIPFEKSPKLGFTSNFTVKNLDASTAARLLFSVFSDFFHEKKNDENDYAETRTIVDHVGKNLFSEGFTEDDWNRFYNFCGQALQFYLSCGTKKVSPPMAEVNLRNQKAEMGDVFFEWAEVYFSENSGNCDKLLLRKKVLDDYNLENNAKWQTRKLSQAIKAFCRFKNQTKGFMVLNPKEIQNEGGRIIRKHEGRAADFIYLQTKPEINDKKDDEL